MTDRKLLPDLYEFLLRVEDYMDGRADADHDGETHIGNEEMGLLCELQDNDYFRGLISRVKAEMVPPVVVNADDFVDSPTDGWCMGGAR